MEKQKVKVGIEHFKIKIWVLNNFLNQTNLRLI